MLYNTRNCIKCSIEIIENFMSVGFNQFHRYSYRCNDTKDVTGLAPIRVVFSRQFAEPEAGSNQYACAKKNDYN